MRALPATKKLPRYKVIRCRATKSAHVIARFDRNKYPGKHVPAEDILSAIRRHYKKHHPKKFAQMVRKAEYSRKEK